MPKILIGLPTYDSRTDSRQALYLYGARRDNLVTDVKTRSLSLLAYCFNNLWCDALNDKTYDYFLLMHADIVPCAPTGWISKLIQEAHGYDLLSALVPVKNQDGLTSTAMESAEHPTPRRLSLHEANQLPTTFTARDVAKVYGWEQHAEQRLLLNTGLMLMDLRRNRDKWEQMYFRITDRIEKRNGKFVPLVDPEDWDFSRQAHAQGLKVAVTRAVTLLHNGSADYSNAGVWGNLEHDTLENIGV